MRADFSGKFTLSVQSPDFTRWPEMRPALAIGLAVSLFVLWLGPFSFYSPAGTLDPWIPLGYWTNFRDMLERFGVPYYVTRLPYIIPGLVLYKVFSPIVANFLLNLCILMITSTALCLIAIRRGVPSSVAAAIASALVFNPYFVDAVAWDYPDGPTIALLMAGLVFVFAPPKGMPALWQGVLAGVMWTMAGSTQLVGGLVILPGICALYLMAGETTQARLQAMQGLVAGSAATLAVFMILSKVLLGLWFYLGPQFRQFTYTVSTPGYLAAMWGIGLGWIATAYRLAAIIIPGLILLAMLSLKKNQLGLGGWAAAVLFVGSIGLYGLTEFGMQAVTLRISYMGSCLIVPMFVAVAFVLGVYVQEKQSTRTTFLLACAIFLGAVIPTYAHRELVVLTHASRLVWSCLCVSGLLLIVVSVRAVGPTTVALSLLLTAMLSISTLLDSSIGYASQRRNKASFVAVLQTQAVLRSGLLHGKAMRFWYDSDERLSLLFHSISVLYLWGYRDFTKELPRLSEPDLTQALPPKVWIVHLTQVPQRIEARKEQLVGRNIGIGHEYRWEIRSLDDIQFWIVVQETTGQR